MAEKQIIETGSENTMKAYEFLKENSGTAYTIKEVAEALELTSPKVTGGLVSLAKKDVVLRGDEKEVGEKTYKTFMHNPEIDVEFKMKEAGGGNKLTDKGVALLQFLQGHDGEDMTANEIGEAMGIKGIAVNGSANSLVKKGLAAREVVEVDMPEGETKEMKVIVLTEEGRNYTF